MRRAQLRQENPASPTGQLVLANQLGRPSASRPELPIVGSEPSVPPNASSGQLDSRWASLNGERRPTRTGPTSAQAAGPGLHRATAAGQPARPTTGRVQNSRGALLEARARLGAASSRPSVVVCVSLFSALFLDSSSTLVALASRSLGLACKPLHPPRNVRSSTSSLEFAASRAATIIIVAIIPPSEQTHSAVHRKSEQVAQADPAKAHTARQPNLCPDETKSRKRVHKNYEASQIASRTLLSLPSHSKDSEKSPSRSSRLLRSTRRSRSEPQLYFLRPPSRKHIFSHYLQATTANLLHHLQRKVSKNVSAHLDVPLSSLVGLRREWAPLALVWASGAR